MVGKRSQLPALCILERARALDPIDRKKATVILEPLARAGAGDPARRTRPRESGTPACVRFGGANVMLIFGDQGLLIIPVIADVITGVKVTTRHYRSNAKTK